MSVSFTGELQQPFNVEIIHGPSGAKLMTTPPRDNGGEGTTFSPTDLCAASHAACAATVMALYASRNLISIAGIRFTSSKIMQAAPRRIAQLKVRYDITTDCTEEQFEKIVEAGRTCPVRLSLGPVEVVEEYCRCDQP